MAVEIWHPETGATVLVADESVWHYRQSGWMTVAEKREQDELAAAREAADAQAQKLAIKAAAPKAGGRE